LPSPSALLVAVATALVVATTGGAALAAPAGPGSPAAAPAGPSAPAAVAPAAVAPPAVPPAPAVPPSPKLLAAEQRATALRMAVDALTLQAEQATEALNRANEQLAQADADHAAAALALRQAQLAALSAAAERDDRVRDIYKDGGSAGLYASMLAGTDVADLLRRSHLLRDVLANDQAVSDTARAAMLAATAAEARVAAVEARQAQARADAAREKDRVIGLLADQERLLASTDSAVLAMAEEEWAAAQLASQRRFAAALADAAGPAAAATAPLVNGSPYAAAAVTAGLAEMTKPYVWGASGPDAFDCSGLTSYAYGRAGLRLPRTAAEQWASGQPVTLRQLSVGDLLFWASSSTDAATIHHVAMYLGGAMMLAAPHTGDVVRIQPVYMDGFFGAVRPGVLAR
jgi:peptidoglycan DL-endopeptidase CwlO